ncbi:class I SAM-dependent methyltransferase [Pseudomonas salomonii]|uniref:Ubiquinone/menaquinone biosynthesis C-methylase UbiE n=1 Tax=Pseudomonas salomonii TaxID=191391 RepID=A0A1H3C3X8_9PSED|nr:class I SAM-dependent methyltransferase [Pseudomonas salomonii]SDX48801.1 Ubiquinone/menaquinone biosynthesis C-methylase UbiE [Pseudomonas salomonii]
MSIDFHSSNNRYTYAARDADSGWATAINSMLAPSGKRVADIGCGGGIYSIAWSKLGASEVTGVDFSAEMVAAAREKSAGQPGVSFQVGAAENTHLANESMDIVFERALIHHLKDYDACFSEAFRVLAPGGKLLIQDRTPDDAHVAGSPVHIRGYFFECFPRLQEIEASRRPTDDRVVSALLKVGFENPQATQLWEIRKTYENFEDLESDLRNRTGRSILHELDDEELTHLISFIGARVDTDKPIKEMDRWTLWLAEKP